MQKDEFQAILKDQLLPIVSGAELGDAVTSKSSHSLVAYQNPCVLLVKPSKSAVYRCEIKRSQKFLTSEKELAELFLQELSKIERHSNEEFFDELMNSLPRRVICRFLRPQSGSAALFRNVLEIEAFASQTYEGKPIVVAFGITGSVGYGPIKVEDLWKEDFSRVLSNAFDTIYLGGNDGKVIGLDSLDDEGSGLFTPYRFNRIANWCEPNRVAIALNRNGEMLLFQHRRLQFAKRRGEWIYYSHESVLSQLGQGLRSDLRRAIYDSCLDVSFARSGGCISILNTKGQKKAPKVIDENDLLSNGLTAKTKLFQRVIKKLFQNIDRRIRQELLAMDGAMVMSPDGTILAIGAIVKIPGGSTGGGRKAAAIQLSKLGLGIKISSDGPITGFRNKKEIFKIG